MNKSLWIGMAAGAAVAAGAGAVAGLKIMSKGPQYADVVQVTALTRTLRTPRQACHEESVVHQRPARDSHQVFGTVAGAVVGGLLGHYVGGGTGRDLATAAGAAAGGYAGNRIENRVQRGNTYTTSVRKCATVYDRSVEPEGYRVRYRLGDKEGTVHMDHDPGRRIPVAHGQLVLGDGGSQTS
ncbi:MAG TPA: glycine zipper 2TM domain-containing protein [Steroidobacteraceae bacterium]|nr:glycine zipper 2TM domain-containing protein [Steroidobacteraceae bacterium]